MPAGSTNLLQWNPTAANQETDAQYLADSQRSGGATDPSIFDSILANKLFYQCTTYLFALFTAFANKGFSTSDASAPTLVTQCGNFLTTADIKPSMIAVPYSPALVFDCSKANGFQCVLTGPLSSFSVINTSFNQPITVAFTQNGVGGYAVTWPSNVLEAGVVDTTPNATSTQNFVTLIDNNLHPAGVMTVS